MGQVGLDDVVILPDGGGGSWDGWCGGWDYVKKWGGVGGFLLIFPSL